MEKEEIDNSGEEQCMSDLKRITDEDRLESDNTGGQIAH